MRVTTIVGARPQFIKAAPVSRALRAVHIERLVHTGQHYDAGMSAVFFEELGIPAPDVTLAVGSGAHGAQTGRMLEAVEADLRAAPPDAVLVYGDTNSTLAGALAAAKLGIPVVHVEAGLRSFVRDMPEEINRVLTDRLSRVCCCPTEAARAQLAAEGITEGVVVVGDVMLDALRETAARVAAEPARLARLGVAPGGYALATIHRAANTDDPARLAAILDGVGRQPWPVLWPVHPRTRAAMARAGLALPPTVRAVEPLGYGDLVAALQGAALVLTDSGGLQKEAYWMGVPCVTLRDETEWTETVESGWNILAGGDPSRIADAAVRVTRAAADGRLPPGNAYGEPGAAARVVEALALLR